MTAFNMGCYTVAITPVPRQPEGLVPLSARIDIPEATRDYTMAFRCWSGGIGNRWKVLVGDSVVKYADAYLPSLFPQGDDVQVRIDVVDFKVQGFRSIADLQFTVADGGRELLRRTYHGEGASRAAGVTWGGAFAMKGMVSSTTHEAMEQIFSQFRDDVCRESPGWNK
jgi:hypothetical protein